MCRRSLQSSCDDKKAKGNNLYEQIDDLAAEGTITKPLKELAHKVRLVANKELHAGSDGLDAITEKDAEAVITFTRHYFEHVYVMPASLRVFDAPTPPPTGPSVS
jgi:uncharacterized protein DUF4145